MLSFLKYNLLSIAWALTILVLCLLPGKDLPDIYFFGVDKMIHLTIYILLALFTFYGWEKQSSFDWLHRNTFLKIIVLTASYGFLIEIIQELFTADRHFEIMDALINAAGAVAGSFIYQRIKSRIGLSGK